MGRGFSVRRLAVSISAFVLASSGLGLYFASGPAASATGSTTSVWMETLDSCSTSLDGGSYILTGNGTTLTASNSGSGTGGNVSGSGCPRERGSCTTVTTGCVQITGVPVPSTGTATYTVHMTVTPPGNNSNPEGYAACRGGSACQVESATVNVFSDGSVQATTAGIYPTGVNWTLPKNTSPATYAGTTADPVTFHTFGLALPGTNGNPQCDGDSDADDHSTGSPSGNCQYPEASEPSVCEKAGFEFPWGTPRTQVVDPVTCKLFSGAAASTTTTSTTSSVSSSSSSSSSSASSGSSTTTTTTTTSTGSPPSVVQDISQSANATTITFTPSATTAGNLLVLALDARANSNGGATVSSITDNASGGSNTWSQAAQDLPAGQKQSADIYYVDPATSKSITSVTMTWGTSSTTNARFYEVGGIVSSPLDQHGNADGSSSSPSVSTGILAQASEWAVAMIGYGNASNTTSGITSGWTNDTNVHNSGTNGTSEQSGHQGTSATSALTYASTLSGSSTWSDVIATFKASSVTTTTSMTTTTSSSGTSITTTTTTSSTITPTTTTTVVTTTSTPSTTTTSSTSSATTTSTGTCSGSVSATTQEFTGSVPAAGSTSNWVATSATGTLTSSVTWTGGTAAELIIYNGGLTVLADTGSSSTQPLTSTLQNEPAGSYKIKIHNPGSSSINFTLTVTHC